MAGQRYTLRNLDVPSRKRIKRSYGTVYKFEEQKEIGGNDRKEKKGETGQAN